MDSERRERVQNEGTVIVQDLRLDRVVASHPEIGPTPPDGGYGWLIFVSCFLYHITSPSILIMYGLIIVQSNRLDDPEDGEVFRIWDVDIALVPVLLVVIKLLLESWCRTVVKLVNMPRLVAISGLCTTVAGVLLSSYATDANENDHIINIFAGIFAGAGCSLTGQQTDVILTHYFREKLQIVQTLVKIAPTIGNCLVPLLIGYLTTKLTSDYIVMVYGAVLMQNSLFLASFTRPIYIERAIYNAVHRYTNIRDAVEDEDEDVFTNRNIQNSRDPNENPAYSPNDNIDNNFVGSTLEGNNTAEAADARNDDETIIATFKSKNTSKEVMDPTVQVRENRFSSNFSDMLPHESHLPSNNISNENRFSNDFTSSRYTSVNNYEHGLNVLSNESQPEPLYRETTVVNDNHGFAYIGDTQVTEGTARRTASIRRNIISVFAMFGDIDFYLYTLLHLNTTFGSLILAVIFPPLILASVPSLTPWDVSGILSVCSASAFCFVLMCIVLPKSHEKKERLCTFFCVTGALGFYGLAHSYHRSFFIVWGIFSMFATAAASVIQQPLYSATLNEFDHTATSTAANTIVATFVMVWCIVYNYSYRVCFFVASILQTVTACVFIMSSLLRRRRLIDDGNESCLFKIKRMCPVTLMKSFLHFIGKEN